MKNKSINTLYLLFLIFITIPFSTTLFRINFSSVYATPNMNDICVPTGVDWAIAVGDDGTIVRLDSNVFTIQRTNPAYDLHSVYFFNSTTGWAVGTDSTILYYNGMNWTVLSNGTGLDPDLNSIFFIDANTGWAAGDNGTIIKTTDGGLNWNDISFGSEELTSIYFFDADTGWVGGDSTILKTTDGGQTWNDRFDSSVNITSIHFYDVNTGWAVGWKTDGTGANRNDYHYIFKTTNGGVDWAQQVRRKDYYRLNSVHFIDLNNGWTVGNMNYYKGDYPKLTGTEIKYTIDGGSGWKTLKLKTDFNFNSIFVTSDMKGWMCGDHGVVLYSNDVSKQKWGHVLGETKHELESVFFVNDTTGWIVGEKGTIMKTTDGGIWWQWQHNEESVILDSNTMQYDTTGRDWFLSVHFFDENLGWACGSRGVILKTVNGGDNWEQMFNITYITDTFKIDNVPKEFRLEDIYFTDDRNGWAVGEDGLILHSGDGGDTWQMQNSGTNFRLESVYFYDNDNGWIVGSIVKDTSRDKQILKTTDRGVTWNKVDVPTKEWLSDVYSPNGSLVLAVGSIGNIIRSADDGDNWTKISGGFLSDGRPDLTGTPLWLESVFFPSQNIGYAVGGGIYSEEPIILKTTDNGNNWLDIRMEGSRYENEAYLDVHFVDDLIGWAVGNKGSIIKTETGGLSSPPNPVPNWVKITTHDAPLKHPLDYNYDETAGQWDYSEELRELLRELP